MKKLLIVAACIFVGCTSQPKFVEGTSLTLGAYIPWQSNLYGVEIMSYVNGCVVRVPTNMAYEISRQHTVTNDWMWGMLNSIETSDTKVILRHHQRTLDATESQDVPSKLAE